ncbi:hypothetical protein IVG45_00985 [Methylomonas sp. LL1]|uniref:F0F1 ATP synthase subunit B family protein n=1 Tax=Methylomonas sp. LL1 TaxID=2785785 RepID=UPI0018C360A3|nr:hypothetical protein [Methylomonas sp. LL1]QPK63591.1 hypothetical protein IVG45_00985 [Methylomonas sp. LL1]
MRIDWLTVGAQWINFLILMWLLHRFLYQPIIQAMDRRKQNIEVRMEEASQKALQAEQQAQDYRDKLAELEIHRAELLAAAKEEAAAERRKLVEHAREETAAMAEQWRREVEREKSEFQHRLQRELGQLIIATSRKVLQDLSSFELEQALFANFFKRLQGLSEHEKRLLSESGNVVLASSFELNEELRSFFAEGLRNMLAANLAVRFEPLSDSLCGLMLISPSYTLEWRVERYFESLEDELENVLNQAGKA